ncbi:MAG: N-acetylmuramoyl-L-alanine amidase [Oscillatoriales cyanobacterium]|nr:MAG: N-acetylmuramoyl-L-alanine amidase [Oscillatoriales cyanobacterium]
MFLVLLQSPVMRARVPILAAEALHRPFETPLLLSSFLPAPALPILDSDELLPIPPSWRPSYIPLFETALADPSNYDQRATVDAQGNPVPNYELLVVLHETVGSADSALALFQNYHPNDADQVSYHAIIRRNGTIVYIVPKNLRAFGAGNSAFITTSGQVETVQTNPNLASSVNNFAYHISLESPSDGFNYDLNHSGYTELQYQSLAWLIDDLGVSETRVTTHAIVDRGGERSDPRSFDRDRFLRLLRAYSGQSAPSAPATPVLNQS